MIEEKMIYYLFYLRDMIDLAVTVIIAGLYQTLCFFGDLRRQPSVWLNETRIDGIPNGFNS